jgi:MYXO-CTERM domain-containing protein
MLARALVLLALVGSALQPAMAHAESFPVDIGTCGLGSFEPTPPSGMIPSNIPRIFFPARTNLALVDGGGTEVSSDVRFIPAGTVLLPLEPLTVGARYELVRRECLFDGPVASYTVGDALPEATALGSLSLELRAHYPDGRAPRAHFVVVTLDRDPSLEPWLDAYDWWLSSGSVGAQSLRRTSIQVDVTCEGRLAFTADAEAGPAPFDSLPQLRTSAMDTFACADALVVDRDTGRTLTADEIAEIERRAMEPDAGTPDAGMGSIDAGRIDMPTEPDTNGNCAASPGAARTGWPLALLAVAAALARARRRRTPRAP